MRKAFIEIMLADARRNLTWLRHDGAAAALHHGALSIDIRPSEQRRRDGESPGSIVIDRTVLWRLDPNSPDRIPPLADGETQLIIIRDEG